MTAHILQLTDLHLQTDPDATLKEVPTYRSLEGVLEFIDAGSWSFDLTVITGDLAHDEQLATYESLKELLGDRFSRLCLIPGNHDDRAFMRQVFPDVTRASDQQITFSEELAGWRLLGVDSHVQGEVPGRIDEQHLDWLESELSQHADLPTILFTHHPPFQVHSEWIDKIGLREPDPLNALIAANPQIRVVSSGHVHQQFDDEHNDLRRLATPSTGVQFTPREATIAVDQVPPGFRIFTLDGDAITTEVVRLPASSYPSVL